MSLFFDIECVALMVIFVVMLLGSIKLKGRVTITKNASLITTDTSIVMKALCCIVIVICHFASRIDGGLIIRMFAKGGGNFALFVFLLLSAYGITKSELSHPTSMGGFAKHRLPKLLLPNILVMAVFIAIYWLIGADLADVPSEMLKKAKVNLMFGELGSHRASFFDCLGCFVGAKSINVTLWFVGVTAYHYIAFCISKTLFDMQKRRISLLVAYTLLLAIFGIVTYKLNFPAHYWRNLWVLVLGLSLALYERELFTKGVLYKIGLWVVVNIIAYLYVKITKSAGSIYIISANIGFIVIFLTDKLFACYYLIQNSYIMWLGGLSYFIYLVHGYLFPIEWWSVGYISVTFTVIVSVLIAYAFSLVYLQIGKAIR